MFGRIKFFITDKIFNFKIRCQRFKRGYAYSDVWNMYNWFLEVIPPMLTKLRDDCCGVPIEFENNGEGWKEILTEMIDCLNNMDEDKIRSMFGTDSDCGFKTFSRQDYIDMNELMEANKNRFFELFSKYFYDLWD